MKVQNMNVISVTLATGEERRWKSTRGRGMKKLEAVVMHICSLCE
jgi:hypothetical protein